MITHPLALMDMDDTLFDYIGSLEKKLELIRSPQEEKIALNFENKSDYLKKRADLITRYESFWSEMPKFQLGWDIFDALKEANYRIMILSKGAMKNPVCWSGKKKCIDKHFGKYFDITLTSNKSLVYGNIFVDDYIPYIKGWLSQSKEGRVIMPAHKHNEDYKHSRVIRYDGTNLEEVKKTLIDVRKRVFKS